MRTSVWVLITLLLGAFAAHFVLADRGYVLINFRGYVVEMSVPGLALALIALYLAVRGLVALVEVPRRWRAARTERRQKRSGSDLMNALVHLTEGDWARGERLLSQGVRESDAPLVNYLLAARAAHYQGATERRDEWLKLATDASPDGATSALLTHAELELAGGDAAAAVAALQGVAADSAGGAAAAGLLARAYRKLGDRAALAALLPRLARAPLPAAERAELVADALAAELDVAEPTAERLTKALERLPAELKSVPGVVAVRARALERMGRGPEAEREIRNALKRRWDTALVHVYGEVRGADGPKQLKQAETWLKTYPEDPALLLTAARLCMATELWGKARSYLESSLAIAPTPESYAVYGELLEQLGEGDRALGAFRSGLSLASPAAADVAVPKVPSLAPPRAVDAKG